MKEFKIRCRAYNNGSVIIERVYSINAENVEEAYSIAGERWSEYLQENRIICEGAGYTAI